MLNKTVFAFATALAVTASTAALAQHSTRYRHSPAWRSAPAELGGYMPYGGYPAWRSAPAQLSPYRGSLTNYGVYGAEPQSYGAGRMPEAFYEQQQPGYPQSPPSGGY